MSRLRLGVVLRFCVADTCSVERLCLAAGCPGFGLFFEPFGRPRFRGAGAEIAAACLDGTVCVAVVQSVVCTPVRASSALVARPRPAAATPDTCSVERLCLAAGCPGFGLFFEPFGRPRFRRSGAEIAAACLDGTVCVAVVQSVVCAPVRASSALVARPRPAAATPEALIAASPSSVGSAPSSFASASSPLGSTPSSLGSAPC
ncbi:hypothetical protein PR002_g26992 [Phytophthora rubi]|uniref:Uncharacterized protein n=1 Tax=Phytophthora rubi TaxID=129364 RepID=A0A6A3HPE3_9STRA|nr:hypothetical protein PR002_g26992 [Phytophthora rubi]